MSTISRLPRGLLSFLDVQAEGKNPDNIGSELAPILNLEPFYRSLVRYEYLQEVDPAADAPGLFCPVEVPINQVWLVHQVGVRWENLSGATAAVVTLGAVVLPFSQEPMPIFSPDRQTSVLPGETVNIGISFPNILVLSPGMRLYAQIGSLSIGAGGNRISLTGLLNKLSI